MAVYKATYCYPFLGSCDIRVAPGETQWITCKVDSSNKKITGYRITIYDENNNLIFPHYDPSSNSNIYHKKDWNISPISELSYGGILPRDENGNLAIMRTDGTKIKLPSQEYLTNSGMNGSYLNLPFFQNQNNTVISSANAVYYQPRYQAEYLIRDIAEESKDYKTPENSLNWIRHEDGRYYYNTNEDGSVVKDNIKFFTSELNGDYKLKPYQTILFYKASAAGNEFFIGHLYYENDSWSIVKDYDIVKKAADVACVITRGSYHDRVYVVDSVLKEYAGDLWRDASGNKIPFSIGKAYKWVITLYQGAGTETDFDEAAGKCKLMNYSNIDVSEWYDMALQKGQILGSCPSRIQIAKYNNTSKEYILPRNKDGSSVILYKTYAQLVAPNGKDIGSRFCVNTYSSSLGHVYPLESDANTITIEGADSVEFFKHSNNPEAVLDTDMVDMASVREHKYTAEDDPGNVELCGIQNIDDVVGENGKYVLVMYQKNPIENGVYKMTSDSENTISVYVEVKYSSGIVNKLWKTYKRDSSKDEYRDGIPSRFAWTHEKTENESIQQFKLTVYTKSRYCKNGDKSLDDNYLINSAKMATWTRAGGYTSWSNYIGKIIYVKGGDKNGGKNFASTADSNGSLLKRPYVEDQSTATPLYFVPERSVVLFPQLLNDNYSIKALGELKRGEGSSGDTVDGVILSSGDYYIKQSTGEIWQYISKEEEKLIKSPGENIEYYYINKGQMNCLQVCKIGKNESTGNNGVIDANSKDLNRAEVLKNTTTKTYIGQYINLDTDMVLRFDNKVVRAKNGSEPKDYLKIQKVDKVTWSIEHEELATPFRGYSSDTDEPYYYKICTFYKKSDENPFYFREMPYLIINDGLGDGYMEENDYNRLSVYLNKLGGIVADYHLNHGSKPSNITLQQALEKLSYVKEAVGPNTGIAERTDTFNFPRYSVDTHEWDVVGNSFKFNFGLKISNIKTASDMEGTIITKYGNFETIGSGVKGLEALKMPDALVNAAQTKWVETAPYEENFLVISYAPISESGYKLPLNGLYKQGNGSSWESYRWVLEKVRFDDSFKSEEIPNMIKNGDPRLFNHIEESIVIKDTGNKYDKKMNAVFYGLLDNLEGSDDSNNIVGVGGKTLFSNIYLVTLYVTDENGITESEKRLFEYKSPAKNFGYCVKSFEATMDCQKECVRISVLPEFIDSSLEPSKNEEFSYLQEFSIFKREYKKLYRYNNGQKEEKILIGNKWDPVVLNLKATKTKTTKTGETVNPINLLDFNVKSGYSYQYVIFPGDYSTLMLNVPHIYANTGKTEKGTSVYDENNGWKPFSSQLSKPVRSVLQYWSIVNLIPVQENSRVGTDIDTYIADTDNVWMFKYQVENGSLTQNISKNELSTLGQYPKIGIGRKNFLSGSVSCYLGSEIIPLSRVGYIERTPAARKVPLSTNEKAFMVEKWRELVATGTPKLLRDTKGQSWIVQIMDGTTTTNETISTKPDTINFSWRQIADTNDIIIYAHQNQTDLDQVCSDEWQEDLKYE